MRARLVAGNWKLHGSLAENARLVAILGASLAPYAGAVDVAVCVPFPYLAQVSGLVANSPLALGAQTVSEHATGAYTGEVSASMLAEFDCRYVIVGHSERRALFGETDARVAEKFAVVLDAGMTPILCVGESLEDREAGRTEVVVGRQLSAVLEHQGETGFQSAVLAYEPVWAIGTGRTATPEQAQSVHAFLRASLAKADPTLAARTRILYGGSVKAANAASLFSMPDVDGGLIGGASLQADEFAAIVRAAVTQH